MDNTRGSILMVIAMLGFAIEDMFIKQMSGALPIGQILWVLGLGGGLLFGFAGIVRGHAMWSRDLLDGAVLGRTACEIFGTVGFVTALSLIDISVASAILQATPLVVTAGAALFLGEAVGWKRWLAIVIGFGGVLLVLRPGLDGFDANALFAVMGVIGLGARDVLTRRIPPRVTSVQISTYAFLALVPTGFLLLAITGETNVRPDSANGLRLLAAVFIGIAAYYAIVAATRIGDVAIVSPFRYARLVFALIVGIIAFGERPDALMLLGAAIIVGSGLFSLWREARVRRASHRRKATL
ncbi:Permease of the drug/metabolite transporter (DMT) superfamily [Cognatiyoonia koreensis]|uniref:Permease of the drug/metabolite transporter (DMT) superfamily n=1 Tax=Cognatiyoonia koreensis TaxID=364200 RepID=A0A1I0PJF3_9RHOB|nr:DMT family transporter [Cognatiyoonia koreensis]SEW14340.1 Permease of the drug/metabolite transporter (DMT) superfamily [Cognatiyoonia koreensis]